MAEGVGEAADAPTVVLVFDGPDDGGSGSDSAVEEGVRIVHSKNEADGSSPECERAGITVLGRLVREPEGRAIDGELGDDGAGFGRDQE